MSKLTDDTRILVALRKYAVAFHWRGTERPRFSLDRIEHPDGRRRTVAHTACRRLFDDGLIETDGWSRPCDYGDWSEPYRLTEAGTLAAAHLADIDDDQMFAPPKVTPPEKLEQGRNRRHAAKVIKVLTFNRGRIRGRRVMFPGAGASLTTPYASSLRSFIPDAVMTLLTPHLEAFVDVGGQESLRITESGIVATAKRVQRNVDERNP
jgi:hypothetical protein